MSETLSFHYGRLLGDLRPGETHLHPFEVTLDDGLLGLAAASFLDATPVWSSAVYARELGFPARPVPPLVCLNLALSFSVHDLSEQAIAHLGWEDIRFPHAAYPGDTVRARSTVLGVSPSRAGDRGVLHARTVLETDRGLVVCAFERKVLVRGGRLASRPTLPRDPVQPTPALDVLDRMPPDLRGGLTVPDRRPTLWGSFDDFAARGPGAVFTHTVGRTVGTSEHMQLATLFRNTHPLHSDEIYCRRGSFTKEPIVCGGLVFAWAAALASRDTAGHALWDLGYEAGAHPNAVAAGDTLYALSKLLSVEDVGPSMGVVRLALVCVKNMSSPVAWERWGEALFVPERDKADPEERIPDKVFEIRRALLVGKRDRGRD